MNICKSGGATGADTLFGECAETGGHGVIHYHFDEKKRHYKNHTILSEIELKIASTHLQIANLKLGRKVPSINDYAGKLLRRNYYQILDSKSLYAATYISEDGKIEGGTAWAVQMFEDSFVEVNPPIYIFDMYTEKWYTRWWNGWTLCDQVPKPQGIYTGIGCRKERMTPAGNKAIKALYGL